MNLKLRPIEDMLVLYNQPKEHNHITTVDDIAVRTVLYLLSEPCRYNGAYPESLGGLGNHDMCIILQDRKWYSLEDVCRVDINDKVYVLNHAYVSSEGNRIVVEVYKISIDDIWDDDKVLELIGQEDVLTLRFVVED